MNEFVKHEREAWRALSGCEATPGDPYVTAFYDTLFGRLSSSSRSWETVFRGWLDATLSSSGCTSNLILVSIYKTRIAAAVCDHAHFRRAQLGALGHYRIFKYLLAVAAARRSLPDALFIMDLSDRADTPLSHGVPKFASTTGACHDALPVPISLKGFGHNLLASRWYTGGGRRMQWPQIEWARKQQVAVWRGAARQYSECLHPSRGHASGNRASHASRCRLDATTAIKCACYAQSSSRARALILELAHGSCQVCGIAPRATWPHEPRATCSRSTQPPSPHPRTSAVTMASARHLSNRLDAAFTPCNPPGDCTVATHLAESGLRVGQGWPFPHLANFTALLELDGFGWQVGGTACSCTRDPCQHKHALARSPSPAATSTAPQLTLDDCEGR